MNVNNPRRIHKLQKFKVLINDNTAIIDAKPTDELNVHNYLHKIRGYLINSVELHINIQSMEDYINIQQIIQTLAPNFKS